MVLAARNADQLADQAAALRAAGAFIAVHTWEFDADDLAAHGPLVAFACCRARPSVPGRVLAFGILDQARAGEPRARHAVPSCTPTTSPRSAC